MLHLQQAFWLVLEVVLVVKPVPHLVQPPEFFPTL
jgi:hypothetical protein